MLDVVTVHARQWRFQLNHKKRVTWWTTGDGYSRPKLQSALCVWVFGGRRLELVNEYKSLGAETGKSSGA
jgi:hypothetical protein